MINSTQDISAVADSLNSNGFAILEGIISIQQSANLIAALGVLSTQPTTRSRGSRLYGVRNLLERVPAVGELAHSSMLLSIARAIIGPSARPVKGIYFDKTPEANWKVAWHQDLSIAVREQRPAPGFSGWSTKEEVVHVQPPAAILERMLTMRLHLDDTQEENGALRVIPGSHNCGRLEADAIKRFVAKTSSVVCHVKAGGLLLMRPLLLHASSSGTSPSHRRIVHLEYSSDTLPYGLVRRVS